MRHLRKSILAGAAILLAAGTAHAAADDTYCLDVALPDGSIAQIEYAGDVAPRVLLARPGVTHSLLHPFAEFERVAAMMERHRHAMLLQMATLEHAARQAANAPPGTVLVNGAPAGWRYTVVSSTTDANGCTRTVEYHSDGSPEPTVTRASTGPCNSARPAPRARPAGTIASLPSASGQTA